MKNKIIFIVIVWFTVLATSIGGMAQTTRIAVLNSANFEEHWSSNMLHHLEQEFKTSDKYTIETFNMQVPELSTMQDVDDLRLRLLDYFTQKPDIIIFVGDPGWLVCSELFKRDWKDIPTIICYSRKRVPATLDILISKTPLTAENTITIEEACKGYNATVMFVPIYVKETIKLMQTLLPNMKNIVYISDNRHISLSVADNLIKVIKQDFPNLNVKFFNSSEMSTLQLLESLNTLDRKTGILYYSWFVSAKSNSPKHANSFENNVWKRILGYTKTPVFILADMDIEESNFVGGYYVSADSFVKELLSVIESINKGSLATAIPFQDINKPTKTLNYTALKWYHINESLFPDDAVYVKAPPTFYEKYGLLIWGIFIGFVCLFLVWLYFRRVSRHHEILNKHIIAAINDPVVLVNGNGVIERMMNKGNENFLRIVPIGEGKDTRLLIPDDEEYKLHQKLLKEVLTTRKTQRMTFNVCDPDNNETVYIQLEFMYSDSNHVVVFAQNITEQENEKAIQEKYRQFLESTLNNLPIAITVKDLNNERKYLAWNKNAEKLFNVPASLVLGANSVEVLDDKLVAILHKTDDEAIEKGYAEGYYQATFNDGTDHTILSSKRVLNNGDYNWLLSSIIDVTHRENEREELRLLNKKYDLILSAIHLVPWMVDMSTRTLTCDLKYLEYKDSLWNSTPQLSINQLMEQIDDNDKNRVLQSFRDLLEGRTDSFKEEFRILINKNEYHWIESYAIISERAENGDVLKVVGASQEIVKRKKMEADLRKSKENAEESNRLKSAFLANMSHEIRTPLNAIIGFSGLIAENINDEECNDYIHLIQTNNSLLLQLINDILDLSKIDSDTFEFEPETIHIRSTLYEILELHKSRVDNTSVSLLLSEDIPDCDIFVDKIRLTQVIMNFLTNASKFTHEGSITLGARYTDDKKSLYIYVKDTGIGVEPEKQKIIFVRFEKLNSFVQGTGLGLSICDTIVKKMGGDIGVKSEPEQGSEFWFTVPLV